jgi:glycosyltransferase involved in cell wall biosynthesis
MRRVCIACYWFPPVPSVGSIRVGALARRLPKYGWQPVIVTPAYTGRGDMGYPVHETADADVAVSMKRRAGMKDDLAMKDLVAAGSFRSFAIEVGKALFAFPDSNRGWIRYAVEAAVGAQPFDAVLTSSPPVSAHVAGRKISRRTGAAWIADLRDLWSQDHNSTAPPWRLAMDRRLERKTFRDADALVTVSDPLAGQLRSLHPDAGVHTILNGFDPDLAGLPVRLTDTFTITHTGTVYQGRRNPAPFLEALAALLDSGRIDRARTRVRMFSREEPWLPGLIERFSLDDVVDMRPWVSWEEALAAQRESQVLLLLHWGGKAEEGVYTGKIFEYLAARRPVLLSGGGEGVLSDLVRETGSGVHVRTREEIEKQLTEWWEEFLRNGSVAYRGDDSRLARYSHDRMAEEFAAVLDEACARRERS